MKVYGPLLFLDQREADLEAEVFLSNLAFNLVPLGPVNLEWKDHVGEDGRTGCLWQAGRLCGVTTTIRDQGNRSVLIRVHLY